MKRKELLRRLGKKGDLNHLSSSSSSEAWNNNNESNESESDSSVGPRLKPKASQKKKQGVKRFVWESASEDGSNELNELEEEEVGEEEEDLSLSEREKEMNSESEKGDLKSGAVMSPESTSAALQAATNPKQTATVRLNVGGVPFECARTLFARHWQSDLSQLVLRQSKATTPFFIERNGSMFRYVLDYMRDGKVWLPSDVVPEAVLMELQHFGFNGVPREAVVAAEPESQRPQSTLVSAPKKRTYTKEEIEMKRKIALQRQEQLHEQRWIEAEMKKYALSGNTSESSLRQELKLTFHMTHPTSLNGGVPARNSSALIPTYQGAAYAKSFNPPRKGVLVGKGTANGICHSARPKKRVKITPEKKQTKDEEEFPGWYSDSVFGAAESSM